MTPARETAPYTLRHIEEMLGLGRSVVANLIAAGFVSPRRGTRNEYRFTFQDVVLLRTAHRLRAARVPPRRLLRSLKELRAKLPAALPLSGLRIQAVGNQVAVREGSRHWEAASGQLLLDFEVTPESGSVAFIEYARPAPQRPESATAPAAAPHAHGATRAAAAAEDHLAQAIELEATDPARAEDGYRAALALDPTLARAAVNLAALLCEAGRCADAIDVCTRALENVADEPLLHFNLAIALEDAGRTPQALASYEQCLRLDPRFGDAHFNAARLYEALGRKQDALRHYSAYRRIEQAGR